MRMFMSELRDLLSQPQEERPKVPEKKMVSPYAGKKILLVEDNVQMPLMNGYEATTKLRAIPRDEVSRIPIVAMTANAFEEDREKAYEAGMNGYISKPIQIQELVETIADVLKVQ